MPKRLLNTESNKTCPVCSTYSFDKGDDFYMHKYECCQNVLYNMSMEEKKDGNLGGAQIKRINNMATTLQIVTALQPSSSKRL